MKLPYFESLTWFDYNTVSVMTQAETLDNRHTSLCSDHQSNPHSTEKRRNLRSPWTWKHIGSFLRHTTCLLLTNQLHHWELCICWKRLRVPQEMLGGLKILLLTVAAMNSEITCVVKYFCFLMFFLHFQIDFLYLTRNRVKISSFLGFGQTRGQFSQ